MCVYPRICCLILVQLPPHQYSPTSTHPLASICSTALAIAGSNFVVVAADSRLARGYSILSRDVKKVLPIHDKVAVATGGCWADVSALHKMLTFRSEMYEHDHGRAISASAFAQMLSTTLYNRRFFPYYAFNVVAGLDAEGAGVVYTYDAVGSFESVKYACQGAGQKLIIPLLDNLVGHRSRQDPVPEFTAAQAVELVKEAFVTACERDIYTGDSVDILIMTSGGSREERFELKKD